MHVVIEISSYDKEWITNGYYIPEEINTRISEAICHGIPLPKGHGRIADMDEAIKCLEDVEGEDAIWAIALIEWACGKRTILEADKEESEIANEG